MMLALGNMETLSCPATCIRFDIGSAPEGRTKPARKQPASLKGFTPSHVKSSAALISRNPLNPNAKTSHPFCRQLHLIGAYSNPEENGRIVNTGVERSQSELNGVLPESPGLFDEGYINSFIFYTLCITHFNAVIYSRSLSPDH